jgi:hypothetical protein
VQDDAVKLFDELLPHARPASGRNKQKKLEDHKLLLPGWRRFVAVLAWEEEKQAASSCNANLLLCLRACFKGNGRNHSH